MYSKSHDRVRLSSDDRTKEILDKYKVTTTSLSISVDNKLPMNSLKSEWDKLMNSDDNDSYSNNDSKMLPKSNLNDSFSDYDDSPVTKKSNKKITKFKDMIDVESESENALNDDSFDISEADLEVYNIGIYISNLEV